MIRLAARAAVLLLFFSAAAGVSRLISRDIPNGEQLAYSIFDGRFDRVTTEFLDVPRALRYRFPAAYAPNTLLTWLNPQQLLLQQAGVDYRFLLFEFGRGLRELKIPADCRDETVSGSGRQLSCVGEAGGGVLVFDLSCVLDGCERDPHRYVSAAVVEAHFWSPDGEKIALADISLRGAGLVVVNLNDEQVTRVNNTLGGVTPQVGWSADSARLAYYAAERGQTVLHVFDLDEEAETLSVPLEGFNLDDSPSWSPDGREIALYQVDTFGTDVYTISTVDGMVRWLTDGGGASAYPRWSPGGRHIAFYASRDGEAGLYIMRSDRWESWRVSENRLLDVVFSWRPCDEGGC